MFMQIEKKKKNIFQSAQALEKSPQFTSGFNQSVRFISDARL